MAVRLGNNKWTPGEKLKSEDLNDTFKAVDSSKHIAYLLSFHTSELKDADGVIYHNQSINVAPSIDEFNLKWDASTHPNFDSILEINTYENNDYVDVVIKRTDGNYDVVRINAVDFTTTTILSNIPPVLIDSIDGTRNIWKIDDSTYAIAASRNGYRYRIEVRNVSDNSVVRYNEGSSNSYNYFSNKFILKNNEVRFFYYYDYSSNDDLYLIKYNTITGNLSSSKVNDLCYNPTYHKVKQTIFALTTDTATYKTAYLYTTDGQSFSWGTGSFPSVYWQATGQYGDSMWGNLSTGVQIVLKAGSSNYHELPTTSTKYVGYKRINGNVIYDLETDTTTTTTLEYNDVVVTNAFNLIDKTQNYYLIRNGDIIARADSYNIPFTPVEVDIDDKDSLLSVSVSSANWALSTYTFEDTELYPDGIEIEVGLYDGSNWTWVDVDSIVDWQGKTLQKIAYRFKSGSTKLIGGNKLNIQHHIILYQYDV